MPEISIIVPVYKTEKYLDRCVKSILGQTFHDFELILVDDGSPDNCPQMCDKWAMIDDRIKVIHKKNGGPSSARNVGLDNALGNYISYVDSDDWIAADMCEYLLKLIKDNRADIVSTAIRMYDDTVDTSNSREQVENLTSKQYVAKLLKVNSRHTEHYACGKLYNVSLWNEIRWPVNFMNGEDLLVAFEITLKATNISCSNQRKYFYFNNQSGITGGSFNDRDFELLDICDKIYNLAQLYGDSEIQYWAKMNRYRADFGLLCKSALKRSDDSCNEIIDEKLRVCLKNFRSHYRYLMGYSLPFDRKILMTFMYMNYGLFCWCAKKGIKMCKWLSRHINDFRMSRREKGEHL